MIIINCDSGKLNGKGMSSNQKKIIFRNNMQIVDTTVYNKDTNTHHIKWKNQDYLLGDGVKNVDYNTSKKKLLHKLSAYTMCAKLMEDEEMDEIRLVILAPLSTYSDKQKREEFRQYILDDGIIDFELDGEKKTIILKDVVVFAEAIGTAFANVEKFKNNLVGIIDIGGLNCNGIILNNFTPVKGTEFTINAGAYMLMEKINKELNKQLDVNIQDYQMEHIIKHGYRHNRELADVIIQGILSQHFNEILRNMKANNWDTDGLDIVVTGGGSLDLGLTNVQKYIPHAQMSNDPLWDNCIGGLKVGEMIYE